eukprot:TRINITY_DN60425_c0_g1_i1.p1 TRINITY_DN60425_c0_g1~~TRINITY_DN60425_c0_g1_i1.p1  ORF type:complete len:143 (-),score=37.48 TRINITY_DN60425_c0_g1_i1:40-468(-)
MVFFFFKQKTAYEMQRGLVGSEMCIRDSPVIEEASKDFHDKDREVCRSRVCVKLVYFVSRLDFEVDFLGTDVDHRLGLCCWIGFEFFNFQSVLVNQECYVPMYSALIPVSYTHLTLPTILLVQISVVAVSLKKKKNIHTSEQ